MGTVSFKSGSEKGFSLIEVCIALMIVSLLMIPMIQAWNLYIKAKKISDTKAVLDIVDSALIKYAAKYGRYPIPENPNTAIGAVLSGASATIPPTGWPACAGDDAVVCQTGVNTFPTAANTVLVGTIPYATLGIPYRSAMDGYGYKLTYAVTSVLTVAATFDDDSGGIEVLDNTGNSIYGPAAGGVSRSHFFIGSHGEDGAGAFSFAGGLMAACNTNVNSTDFENCNGDGTFRNNYNAALGLDLEMFGGGATHFDDFSVTNNRSSTGMWLTVPQTPDIRSSNFGNIAIGACATNPCVPKSHIEVTGTTVTSGRLLASRLCGPNDSNCTEPSSDPNYIPGYAPPGIFSAEQIVGAPPENMLPDFVPPSPLYAWDNWSKSFQGLGILCTNGRPLKGLTLRGNGTTSAPDEVCLDTPPLSPTLNTSACAPGTYAKAITFTAAGKFSLTCIPKP